MCKRSHWHNPYTTPLLACVCILIDPPLLPKCERNNREPHNIIPATFYPKPFSQKVLNLKKNNQNYFNKQKDKTRIATNRCLEIFQFWLLLEKAIFNFQVLKINRALEPNIPGSEYAAKI